MRRLSELSAHIVILTVGFCTLLYVDRAVSNMVAERQRRDLELAASQFVAAVHCSMDSKIATVLAVRAFYQHSEQPAVEKVNKFIHEAMANEPTFRFLLSVDSDFIVRGVYPRSWERELLRTSVRDDKYSYALAQRAIESGRVAISKPLQLPGGGMGFLLFAPIVIGGEWNGLVIGVFDREKLLGECLPEEFHGHFSLELKNDDGDVIFSKPFKRNGIVTSGTIHFPNSISCWRYVVSPNLQQTLAGALVSKLPMWSFGVLLLVVLMYFVHSIYERRRELEREVAKRTSELRKANERLRELAIKDPLTGIYNRRYFYERMQEELSRARRSRTPVSCLLIDLDNFKQINDTYGHLTGDNMLIETAKILKRNIRREDVLARYGGEEFVILLVGADGDTALSIAERIRKDIEAGLAKKLREEGKEAKITASIGVSEFYTPDEEIEWGDIINRADTALYEAKRSGKNAVARFSRLGDS